MLFWCYSICLDCLTLLLWRASYLAFEAQPKYYLLLKAFSDALAEITTLKMYDLQCFSYCMGQADAYSGIYMTYLNRVLAASHPFTLCSQGAWALSGSSLSFLMFFSWAPLYMITRILKMVFTKASSWLSSQLHTSLLGDFSHVAKSS